MAMVPNVVPKLRINYPQFKNTDFSADIERLGGFDSSSRSARKLPRVWAPSNARKSSTPGASNRSSTRSYPASAPVAAGEEADAPAGSAGSPSHGGNPVADGASLEEWLKSIRTAGLERANREAEQDGYESVAAGGGGSSASTSTGRQQHDWGSAVWPGALEPGSLIPAPEDGGLRSLGQLDGVPLEVFDRAEDFEEHTPDEWLEICRSGEGKGPNACVLHFLHFKWTLLPCWVHGYDTSRKRYQVELADGSEKHVKRLSLRFNAEDADNFARRLDTCRANKAHVELQQAFIEYIHSRDDHVASPMLREQKEQFIREALLRSHVVEAKNYINTIRSLIAEVERSYSMSMKFARVKEDFIKNNGTVLAHVSDETPFKPLLSSFLIRPAANFGYASQFGPDQTVDMLITYLEKQPTLTAAINVLTRSVWQRFMVDISKHRLLDTSRNWSEAPERADHVAHLDAFITHLEGHRKQVTTSLVRYWRDYIVSEVWDRMSKKCNFFVENAQKHLRQPLHRVLRKLDLILSAQLEWFVETSIGDWVAFMRSFLPNPSQVLPPPVIKLSLAVTGVDVVMQPAPDDLISRLVGLIDNVSEATKTIFRVECDLVPFCNLARELMFDVSGRQPLLDGAKQSTEEVLRKCLEGPQEVQAMYQKYSYLMLEEARDLDPLDIEATRGRTMAYRKAGEEIQRLTATVLKFPFFELHCKAIIETLASRAFWLADVCLRAVSTSVKTRIFEVMEDWGKTQARILSNPDNEEELAQLKQFMADVATNKTKPLIEVTRHIHSQIDLLAEFSMTVEEEFIESAFKSFARPAQVFADVVESERSLDSRKQRFMDKLEAEKVEFKKDMVRYQDELEQVKTRCHKFSLALKYQPLINSLKEHLDRAQDRVKSFTEREKLFEMDPDDYSDLNVMVDSFDPYYKLWIAAGEWKHSEDEWLTGPLSKLNAAEIEQAVEEAYKDSSKMIRQFEGSDIPQQVARDLCDKISEFKNNLPVIRALCQEAFLPVHLNILFDELEKDLDMDDGLTLHQMLEIGILNHIETVERISGDAQKQYTLKVCLSGMKNEWSTVQLVVGAYKNSGTYIVKGTDDIQNLLDEHIIKTQGIRGSQFVKPIEKEVKDWEAKLLYIQDLLETWMTVQRSWLYLEPIFSSDDIQRQMKKEAKCFQQVDEHWRSTMEVVNDQSLMLDVADMENLLASFADANRKLDTIQKGLNDYLETKRLAFPRFFFLSNDELLMILSQTKDPTAVQPHMGKCFEGINRVRFNAANDIIEAMVSVEGEIVELHVAVNVMEGDKKGNVEKWLLEVQESMIDCLTKVTGQSITSYAHAPRNDWVLQWPGQVVICVDNIFWTDEVTAAIDGGSIDAYAKQCVSQLSGLVDLVRGDLSKLARQTLTSLVTIDVHNLHAVSALSQARVANSRDFDWMSQLRYYWRPKETIVLKETRKLNQVEKCEVSIINATLYYGFEYLGNSDRLVITPLTDRCYRTLMGAFHLYYGGGPEGPAGTGKTESTKDLAKAVSVQCVVFNCSDGLDYIAMGKFFKGLAASGAWCCFDEFNRINLEVLSVISQQVQTIQFAIRDQKVIFTFEDTEIKLVPTCAVNITMNPGYAGRSELPDNLKALFRPCAMMVPNYELIGEIVLYSNGFENAKTLSRKAVGSLKLGSEQLSSQDHYDFGMRALKSILVRAGALRRMYGTTRSEEVLALSALYDVNLPKFTSNDIPLFLGITGDLFPGVEMPPSDYGKLIAELEGSARSLRLQPKETFIRKCLQLWETIMVRHGLMLVGQTVSGKTEVGRVLSSALATVADDDNYLPVQVHKINPKSIKQGQLYGDFDENTHEWTDGILALTVRYTSSAEPTKRQWILLDGPVDAIWIENMNTLLDDNKKLCLNSGEIIKLTPVTTMMFEVEDLMAASPATVSRCGMVFLEQLDIGWRVLVKSWLERLPERVQEFSNYLRNLMEGAIDATWEILSRRLVKPVLVSQNWLVINLLSLYMALIRSEIPLEPETKDLPIKEKESKLDGLFWLSLTWSFACTTNAEGRGALNEFIRDVASGHPIKEKHKLIGRDPEGRPATKQQFPESGSIYDFSFNGQTNKWEAWTKIMPSFDIPRDVQVHTIIVPTADTMRNAFFLQTLVGAEHHVLFSGLTGTGKTVVVQQQLRKHFDRERFMDICFAFSAQTSANQTQDIIDGKLEKHRKGTYGPPLGKRCLIFVDDLNMPAKEKYGAQPPIELLRQWMDTGGWYDRKSLEFRSLVHLSFIGAMAPPGAGRPQITPRYQRHFNYVFVVPFDEASLQRIFQKVMQWFLRPFPGNVEALATNVVNATIEVYSTISSEMLPTPTRSHYSFNLRDLARVHQGICLCSRESLPTPEALVKCWAHECQRVFQDRLVDVQDQEWFLNLLKSMMDSHFNKSWKSVVKVEPLIFANFVDPKQQFYQEVQDHTLLANVMKGFLTDYNSCAMRQMPLVLFLSAVQHVCRVVRVLKTPLGNALLVGVGGSGRKSLATLASFIAVYELFHVEVSKSYSTMDWYEDVKRLLMRAGGHNKEIAFLLADAQIPKEHFFEDISSLLNNGEVPNLFNAEDKTQIMDACSTSAQHAGRAGPAEVFAFFTEQCRKNLHLVLAVSPIGEAFRRRVLMFPAMVNCCTIDWFMEWPDEALRDVAERFLQDVELSAGVAHGVRDICVEMQKSMYGLTKRFRAELQRHYYVTPTSYLELINSLKDVLLSKRNDVMKAKRRYDEGLGKLLTTEEQVTTMSAELAELGPILKQTSEDTAELMSSITEKQAEAAVTQGVVSSEEKACSQQAEEARAIKEDCQADLDKALPALNAALDALKNLKKGDLVEVKNMKAPPGGVITVSMALSWCFDIKPKKVLASDGRSKVDDYWETSKKVLWGDPRLLDRLLNYDKDHIPDEVMNKLRPLEEDPNFDPEVIRNSSVAAYGVCKWVRAIIVYDAVAKVVAPKIKLRDQAQAELNKVLGELEAKKEQLREVQNNVNKLLSDFETAKTRKEELGLQVDDCTKKLSRAKTLISGLGGEKARWGESSAKLGQEYMSLTGDVLISSGIIAYLGPFMGAYRVDTVQGWVELMHSHKIPAAAGYSLRAVLGDEVKIRQWVIDKLPNDQVSVENALILSRSRRWPLMIDPQMQANTWVRKTHGEKLKILRTTQHNYSRVLEAAISAGKAVLLENVGETLDPLLEPLLLKAKFKAGNIVMIRLGDNSTEWNDDFRLYITTKLPNPHYSPEICVQVTLLNFMATPNGLEDQMLGLVVAKEEPDTERKRQGLVVDSAQSKAQLKEIEDRILDQLSNAEGNILDDEELINTLANSKVAAQRIEERVLEQEKMSATVQEARDTYVPVAERASALFFVISCLCNVEPMYQYSLEWFISVYELSIASAERFDKNVPRRLVALQSQFVRQLFEKTCDSLFAKDKLMFSMLLAFKSMEVDNELDKNEQSLLLMALSGVKPEGPKPLEPWLTDVSWGRICQLDKLNKGPFKNFSLTFTANIHAWQNVFDAENPIAEPWPGGIKDQMTPLQRALVVFAVRTDSTVTALQEIIGMKLGNEFLEPPQFDLEKSYSSSNSTTPLIFVLSSGADPMQGVVRLGQKLGMDKQRLLVSLGQGQGPKAERAIAEGREGGLWVILQNCHLAPSWMSKLEVMVEEGNPEEVHESFRLWLTSMPSPHFPVSVLQNGLKMTMEPPKGLKANVLRAYAGFEASWFNEACMKSEESQHAFRKMLFGLCFFHALIQERCNYGPLGWNIPYQFSEPDRQICVDQLSMFIEENQEIPYAALRYTAAEANYGGRVTDPQDRRTINFILTDFYCPEILKDDYVFSPSGIYYAPAFGPMETYVSYIKSLPINQMPEAFGLHANANLVAAISEVQKLLLVANSLQPKSGGGSGGQSAEATMGETSQDLLLALPELFDTEEVQAAYPVDYNESMNTVLTQELLRYNKLLKKVRSTLVDVGRAVRGLVVMGPELEEVATGMLLNTTPFAWMAVSYPSLKPLLSYVSDLCARLKFLQDWIDGGIPPTFWLSGFFFTQSFLTGQLQNFARAAMLPIDTLTWNFHFYPRADAPVEKPATGCVVWGLFAVGARWDDAEGVLAESFPKVLSSEVPHIHLLPCETSKDSTDMRSVYPSPLYKTSERKGTLSTTGHSTNFVLMLLMPLAKQHSEKHWTKRGVACLMQLDD